MSGGTDQRQRLPVAWSDGGFKVDEMSLDRRVGICASLAQDLRFVDLNDHDAGTWAPWFDTDETLVLARIASIDRYAVQQSFLSWSGSAPPARLAHEVLALAQQLDGWLLALSGRPPPAAAVREAIEQLINRQLGAQLAWVIESLGAASWAGRSLQSLQQSLLPLWREPGLGRTMPPDVRQRDALRSIFFAFLTAISQVRDLAREQLRGTLATGRHEPAAGLLLSFLSLYESVQQEINRFTDRHIDFYYQQCLGLHPRPAQPDSVHVAVTRDPLAVAERVLPAGTAFVAGKDIAGQPLQFRSGRDLTLGDARVAALCTLRLQRDAKISPEADLGYVTGIKVRRLAPHGEGGQAVPLFGAGPGSREATLGLAIATPLLLLAEGMREIELNLRLSWPRATQNELLASALETKTREQLGPALGALFACWMMSDDDALTDVQREQLARHARGLEMVLEKPKSGLGSPLYLMCSQAREEYRPRDLAFFKYLNDLFEVGLTHAAGWFVAERIQIGRPPRVQAGAGGLQIRIELRPEDPAIVGCDPQVHGAQWPTRLPLLRLQVNPRARIHPYSLFEGARLLEAEARVVVREVKGLVLHNNLGQLDPSKAFSPFGPLPTTSSYLVFGSPEAARKNLSSLALQIEWGGLPQDPGGFAAHYAAYGAPLAEGLFTVALSLLRDGQWQACGGLSAAQPLFAAADAEGRLPAQQLIEVNAESVRQQARASEVALQIRPGTRDGLVRLQLNHPRAAFGHAAYPALLSGTLSAQARRRRAPSLPNPPYTPVIERISLNYGAGARLRPRTDRRGAAAPDGERLLHIHPFGVAEIEPDAQTPYCGLLPSLGPDGSLCIGLQSTRMHGPLSLLFQLRQDEAGEPDKQGARSPLLWSVLEGNHWRVLAASHVQADGTQGMLSSGVVQLDLPALATKNNTVLDSDLFWLRLARAQDLDAAAPLVAVHAQALTLQREIGDAGAADAPLPAGRITQPALPQTGLAAVSQPEASTGWRAAEDERQFRVRAGERLRHKARASLAWDIERLVLEEFPEVFKVKCLTPAESKLGRGIARVVVVPHVRLQQPQDSTRAPRLNARSLIGIRDFLAQRCSPFARLHVCNATYERVQVRCRIQPEPGAQAGAVLRLVNRALVECLSPWHEVGYGARFGWALRCDEVQAVVRSVPGVLAVGPLSMLHLIEEGSERYLLRDTARALAGANADTSGDADQADAADAAEVAKRAGAAQLRHRDAWSLALPLAEHLVCVARSFVGKEPRATGVSLLGVGSTFVVGGGGAV